MRKIIVASVLFFLLPAAASAITVTYSSGQLCPDHATPQDSSCYCNVGYKVSGTSCVVDSGMPPGTYEIYKDIAAAVGFNDDMSCVQLGYASSTDADMCSRYKATPSEQRPQWSLIERPRSVAAGVTNPWAPASQQTMVQVNATSSQLVAPVPPPEPPPPPAASTNATNTPAEETPQTTPEETDPPPAPAPKLPPPKSIDEINAEIDKKLADEKAAADAAEQIAQAAAPAATSTPDANPQSPPQLAAAASPLDSLQFSTSTDNAVDMSQILAGLSLMPRGSSGKESASLSDSQIIPTEKSAEPAKQSLFARVFGWIFSIF